VPTRITKTKIQKEEGIFQKKKIQQKEKRK